MGLMTLPGTKRGEIHARETDKGSLGHEKALNRAQNKDSVDFGHEKEEIHARKGREGILRHEKAAIRDRTGSARTSTPPARKGRRDNGRRGLPGPPVNTKEPRRGMCPHRGSRETRRLPTLPTGLSVPSALAGLTALFGMGRGGSPPL